MPRRLRLALIVLTLVVCSWSRAARADGATVAVVRTTTPADDALLERLRGQVTDLHLHLIEVWGDELEQGLAAQLRAADDLAGRYDASAVLWFDEPATSPETLRLHVLVPATGRVLVREVDGIGSVKTRSATLESAALILRGALRAILAGTLVGTPRDQIQAEAGEPPSPPPPPTTPSPGSPPPPEPRGPPAHRRPPSPAPARGGEKAGAPLRLATALGWDVAWDGRSPAGQQSLLSRVEIGGSSWGAGLALRVGLPAELHDPFGVVRLARHSLVLSGGYAPNLTRRLTACVCVTGGVALFHRTTVATASDVIPSAANWIASPVVGPEIRATFRLLGPMAPADLRLGAAAGLDVIPRAPRIGYRAPTGFVETHRIWIVEPRGQVFLEWSISGL